MSEPGQIPQSEALKEADPNSLSELMSRDPEGFSQQDRQAIIRALRADRARREKADAEAAASGRARPKPGTGSPVVPPSAGALGL